MMTRLVQRWWRPLALLGGLLLIAVVMFLPNGILGGLAKLTSSWRRRAS